MKKVFLPCLCIILSLCFIFSLSACYPQTGNQLSAAAVQWSQALDYLVYNSDGIRNTTDVGALESLAESSRELKAQVVSHEKVDQYPNAKAFLLLIVQYAEVFSAQAETEFLSLSPSWIHSAWFANEIIAAAEYCDTADQFLSSIEDKAYNWLDRYYLGSIEKLNFPESVHWVP